MPPLLPGDCWLGNKTFPLTESSESPRSSISNSCKKPEYYFLVRRAKVLLCVGKWTPPQFCRLLVAGVGGTLHRAHLRVPEEKAAWSSRAGGCLDSSIFSAFDLESLLGDPGEARIQNSFSRGDPCQGSLFLMRSLRLWDLY